MIWINKSLLLPTLSYLVTADIPEPIMPVSFNDPNLAGNPELKKRLEGAHSEEEMKKIFEEYSRPKTNSRLYFYSLPDGNLKNSVDISNDGWSVKNLVISYNNKSVIVNEQDHAWMPPFNIRYRVISVENPQDNKIIIQTPNVSSSSEYTNFELSQDGKWLIIFQPSGTKTLLGEDQKMVTIWDLNTKQQKVICRNDCYSISIYNPNKFLMLY